MNACKCVNDNRILRASFIWSTSLQTLTHTLYWCNKLCNSSGQFRGKMTKKNRRSIFVYWCTIIIFRHRLASVAALFSDWGRIHGVTTITCSFPIAAINSSCYSTTPLCYIVCPGQLRTASATTCTHRQTIYDCV